MAKLEFHTVPLEGVPETVALLCRLKGVVDNSTVEEFEAGMEKLAESPAPNLLVDFQNVAYINSSGSGLLLKYLDQYRRKGGKLVLVRVHQGVMTVLDLLGFVPLFTICADENEAKEQIGVASAAPAVPAPADNAPTAAPALAAITAPESAATNDTASPLIQNEGSQFDELPRQNLRALIVRDRTVLDDAYRCEGMLKKYCEGGEKEIAAIGEALRRRVPADLRNASPAMPLATLKERLVQRLVTEASMDEALARWTVETWGIALNVLPGGAKGGAGAVIGADPVVGVPSTPGSPSGRIAAQPAPAAQTPAANPSASAAAKPAAPAPAGSASAQRPPSNAVPATPPAPAPTPTKKKGCMGMLTLALGAAAAIWMWLK